jgi:hypothetical protein
MLNNFTLISYSPLYPTITPLESEQPSYTFIGDKDINIKDISSSSEKSDTIFQRLIMYISTLVTKLSRCSYSIETYEDNLYGTVIEIKTDLSAKSALELWLKIIDYLPYKDYGFVISVKWLGENDVSEDELIDYMVKIMIKSKIGPRGLLGFSATRMVQEARE